ncbi:hypothetical protein [Desulfovibrio inopinatus]|uniref:hypothetical protein n=1 Tax=Desulfovibrio inopinatus TaxID=102109 RepID=UPI000A030225|nr:hypothetical protein [Desulfovibrio inopinatus]
MSTIVSGMYFYSQTGPSVELSANLGARYKNSVSFCTASAGVETYLELGPTLKWDLLNNGAVKSMLGELIDVAKLQNLLSFRIDPIHWTIWEFPWSGSCSRPGKLEVAGMLPKYTHSLGSHAIGETTSY